MINKVKFSVLFVATLFVFTTSGFAQFSRNDAQELVLNTILTGDLEQVDVYSSYNEMTGTVDKIDNTSVDCPYNGNWVFFVDDKPFTGWFHDCRYIFVSSDNGEYTVTESKVFPRNQSEDFELISEAVRNEPAEPGDATGSVNDGLPPNDHYYAVIISDGDEQQYWNDVSLIYNTLIDVYGYKKENIFVHYGPYGTSILSNAGDLDNDGNNDIDYSAFSSEIHATFNELAGITNNNTDIPALGHTDQLAVFFADVATMYVSPDMTLWAFWNDNGGGPYLDVEDPLEIAQIVNQIECAQMTLTFSFNYADAVMDVFSDYGNPVSCENRFLHACSDDEEKHLEMYITGGDYGEYFYYWSAAARGVYPDLHPWEPGITTGEFPFNTISGLENHPGDFYPDTDEDGYVQMEEAFYYADAMDTWSDDGYYFNPYTPGQSEVPTNTNLVPFEDDLLMLAGYAGHAETPVTVDGSFVIGGTLYFEEASIWDKFEFADNSEIYLINPQSKIVIQENSYVKIGQYSKVAGSGITNEIEVFGKMTINQGDLHLYGLDGNQWRGIVFNNTETFSNINFLNCLFEDCMVTGRTYNIYFHQSDFINGGIYMSSQNITIYECDFNYSYVDLSGIGSEPPTEIIYLFNNDFYGQGISKPAVNVNSIADFTITDTYVTEHTGGIKVYNSGTGIVDHTIDWNYIHNCVGSGITIYNSTADLYQNSSNHNSYGVMFYDRSNLTLTGWNEAVYMGETQRIHDNSGYEVYSSKSSFPRKFHWNAIRDEDNTEPMVYCYGEEGVLDVRYNYWGNNFNPEEDFYPWQSYIWEPIWDLIDGTSDEEQDEGLFNSAMNQKEAGNYDAAKMEFKQLIVEYPTSNFAQAALKELYAIEAFSGNDYSELKSYFNTEQSVQNNTDLKKLSEFLVNFCEIKLENWPTAIAWFENVIQNPESMEDSIFAIIDLGYTYFLMEQSGYKNAYQGTLTQYIPVSKVQFEQNRDDLLALLPGDRMSKSMKESINLLNPGELLQNTPNPFNSSTQIWFKLAQESSVTVNIFDFTGKLIKSYRQGRLSSGDHLFEFSSNGLPAGIYFYSLEINGNIIDSKKMTIIR